MSKKVNTAAVATDATTDTTYRVSLREYFGSYPNVSIRKLAAATEINYGILLKKSKEPIPGEAYDPEAINWTALEEKLIAKGINYARLDWEAMNEQAARKGATLEKDINAFKVGDKVYLRRNNSTPYEILYKTETHIVIMLEGSSEPQAWSISTFFINGPSFQPRAERVTAEEVEEA